MLLATAKVHYAQTTQQVDAWENLVAHVPIDDTLPADVWARGSIEVDEPPETSRSPEAERRLRRVAPGADAAQDVHGAGRRP